MPIIIDGKKTAENIYSEIKLRLSRLHSNQKPGITVIQVGHNAASTFYVNKKNRVAGELGFNSNIIHLPDSVDQKTLIEEIHRLNSDNTVHGILVQLPLPSGIDENEVILSILPEKDVDGFHPVNIGKLMIGQKTFVSCTPAGIMRLLKNYNVSTDGKTVVVVGRSNIVGKPLIPLLINKTLGGNATLIVCHSRTKDIANYTKQGDIVIVAIGKPNWLTSDMIKENAVLIDVGINRVEDNSKEKGYRIVGDIDFDSVSDKCSMITPVPGGVGQTTVAMLMLNTLSAFEDAV